MVEAAGQILPGSGRSRRVRFALLFGVTALLGLWTASHLPGTPPLEGDDEYVLGWASRAGWSDLIRVDPSIYPEWRPLAYATIWLQFKVVGYTSVIPYQVVNIALWIACAGMAGWLVYRLTSRWLATAVTMGVLLTDPRWLWSLVWIDDRQTTMACLFGLMALAATLPDRARLTPWTQVGVATLLLASPLAKEYGLAFALALAVWGWLERRLDVVWPALAAVVVYGVLRTALVGGATAHYCESVGYFLAHRYVCTDSPERLPQMAYNVGATLVGSLFEGVLDELGAINASPARMLLSVGVLAAAGAAWARGNRAARAGLGLIVFNGALSIMLYRTRNQPIALAGLAVSAGIGIDALLVRSLVSRVWRPVTVVLIALIASSSGVHAWQLHRQIDEHRRQLESRGPCLDDEARESNSSVERSSVGCKSDERP